MVAKNQCLMKLRDKGKYTAEINDRLLTTPDEQPDRSEFALKDITLANMASALKQLHAEQQQCVTLFYLEKKSYKEIAEQTGFTLLQVKSYIQNGKRNLKLLLQQLQQNEE